MTESDMMKLRRLCKANLENNRHSRTYLRDLARKNGINADYKDIEKACELEGVKWIDLKKEDLMYVGYTRIDKWHHDNIIPNDEFERYYNWHLHDGKKTKVYPRPGKPRH